VWLLLLLTACGRAPEAAVVECANPLAGCRLSDGVKVRFSDPPARLKSFELDVDAQSATEIHASFQMRGMEMGMNRYRLLPKDGTWRASVMLPACVQGRSDWVLRLEVDKKTFEVPFQAAS
jgi:hypothetical protein